MMTKHKTKIGKNAIETLTLSMYDAVKVENTNISRMKLWVEDLSGRVV